MFKLPSGPEIPSFSDTDIVWKMLNPAGTTSCARDECIRGSWTFLRDKGLVSEEACPNPYVDSIGLDAGTLQYKTASGYNMLEKGTLVSWPKTSPRAVVVFDQNYAVRCYGGDPRCPLDGAITFPSDEFIPLSS